MPTLGIIGKITNPLKVDVTVTHNVNVSFPAFEGLVEIVKDWIGAEQQAPIDEATSKIREQSSRLKTASAPLDAANAAVQQQL